MPSLQQLNEFRTSFRNIGNEPAVLRGQNASYQELPLPDSEPVTPSPFDVPVVQPAPAGMDDPLAGFDPGDFENAAPSEDFTGGSPTDDFPSGDTGIMDDFAFSDFLNTSPDNLPPPPAPSLEPDPFAGTPSEPEGFAGETDEIQSGEDAGLGEEAAGLGVPEDGASDADVPGTDGDDFALPEDLLSGFADDLSGEDGEGEEQPAASPADDSFFDDSSFGDFSPEDFSSDIDFGSDDMLPDFSSMEEAAGESTGAVEPAGAGEAEGSGEDTGVFVEAAEPAGTADSAGDAFSREAFPDESVPPSPPGADGLPDDEFTIPDMEAGAADEPKDRFDAFDFGDGALAPGVDAEAGSQGTGGDNEGLSGLDDFSLPGIDDIFNKAAETADAAGKGIRTGKQAGAVPSAPKKIEDIRITEEELARFRETLALYPLNLRIACEEIIADQSAPADQMHALITILIKGGTPKEAASLAGKILNRSIPIPKGFEKKTGEALEAEQTTFAYVFSRKFLPILRIFLVAVLMAASLVYLAWQLVYIPIHSESIYRRGYERIAAGEYERANERFSEAFRLRRVKQWFYQYAEAFRDERQYLYAEEKYDELLRYYPRDKKGALDYANLETHYLRNYSKADRIIRTNILDYNVDDQEGLLALGDNNLAWGEVEPARYENARQSYARLLERYGWRDPIVERMLLYFIRTDNLGQVIQLYQYFTGNPRKKVSPAILSELGGYLLDKQLEEVRGIPDANIERIEGVRDILIQASQGDPFQPEPRYHLARYYNRFGNTNEERQVLESAIRAFDAAGEESPRRTGYRIDAERRYAQVLANVREYFPAEEQLIKGIGIYEDALNRRLLSPSPEYGRLYADLGDIEYFTKSRDMNRALEYYRRAEQNGWAPPEIQYRIGAAHYHLGQWENALERFFTAASDMPLNRRLLHALGNVSYLRGNYFAAQGYFRRLLDLLEAERSRFPMLFPNERPDHMELAERIMVARNNMGVTMEALTDRTGNPRYRTEALALYSESSRAWDALTRDPGTMIRSTGTNLGFLNSRNILHPQAGYEPRLFNQIDKDVLEPSSWEMLAPPDYRLSD